MAVDGPGDINPPQNEQGPVQPNSSYQPPPQDSSQQPTRQPENHQNGRSHGSRGYHQESLQKPLPTTPGAKHPQHHPNPAHHGNGGSTYDHIPQQSGPGIVGTILNFPSYVTRTFQL